MAEQFAKLQLCLFIPNFQVQCILGSPSCVVSISCYIEGENISCFEYEKNR